MQPLAGVAPKAGRELLIAARFGLVGLAATALHAAVVWTLIACARAPALPANLIAFICAFGVSFAGNYLWTFRAPGRARRAFARFLVISVSGFAANTGLLALLLTFEFLDEATAAIAAIAAVPLVTFLGARFWGFRHDPTTVPSV